MQPPRACVKIRCVAKHVDDGAQKEERERGKRGKNKRRPEKRPGKKRSGTKDGTGDDRIGIRVKIHKFREREKERD